MGDKDRTDVKSGTTERMTGSGFRKDGYNADIHMPVDIEPVPRDAVGAALDIRKDLPESGVVEIHDADDEILDGEKAFPVSK